MSRRDGALAAAAAPVVWLDETDSTNAEALRRCAAGVDDPAFWVAARRQTAGRGRRGRRWAAPEGALTASLALLLEGADPAETATLSFAAALAVADMLDAVLSEAQAPDRAALKWPNDVLLRRRKIAGLLLEAHAPWVVIGVGVNLGSPPPDAALEDPARAPIGLAEALTSPPSPRAGLDRLVGTAAARLQTWAAAGFDGIRSDWLARSEGLGEEIVARTPSETVRGRFADVDADGALVLETGAGSRRIHAADVFAPRSGG